MEYHIIPCPTCKQKVRLPANRGKLSVSCPKCKGTFLFDSNSGCFATQHFSFDFDQIFDKKEKLSMRRMLFLYSSERVGSTLDRVGNFLAKDVALKIIVDRKEVAKMVNHQDTEIQVSEAGHTVCVAVGGITSVVAINAELPGGTAIKIPAGSEEYVVLIDKVGTVYKLYAGSVSTPFYRGLEEYFKKMCQGRGILERIRMPENRNQRLYLDFMPDHFLLGWDLTTTKGLKQWSTGRGEEKIFYSQLGLYPPQTQPGGYWKFIQAMISRVIDSSENVQCTPNGIITERKIHSLF